MRQKKELGIYNTYMFVFSIKVKEELFITNICKAFTRLTQRVINNVSDEIKNKFNAEVVCCINIIKLDD